MARHLTLEERDRIAHLNSRGFAQAAIAKALGRSPSVISRELRLNRADDGTYYGGVAQCRTAQRRLTMTKITHKHVDYVAQRLSKRLKESPDQPVHSMTFDNGTEFAECDKVAKNVIRQGYSLHVPVAHSNEPQTKT